MNGGERKERGGGKKGKTKERRSLTSLECLAWSASSTSRDFPVWTLPSVFLSWFCL